ncbi:ABC transporter permease [Streptomyces sp. NBC_00568]|uniref:ABC transporter permease n=1 Tax=Streptomyces sp. NBC_00568 TaxID=2975779 RepID=UPI00224ED0EA|nr:ABC transporter permease [Streptomyces sp. NBC_00568]MCX4993622.1 ABC transporter permease [Streptomyces sp. NBC_00568]
MTNVTPPAVDSSAPHSPAAAVPAHRKARPTTVRLTPLDLLGLGLLGIRTRKVRAALSALGISIGIATMIIVTAIPASSQKALMQQLSALGTNLLRAQAMPEQGSSKPGSLPVESVEMVERIGPVDRASAVANTNVPVYRSDRVDPADYAGLSVLAVRRNLLQTVGGTVASGRFLNRDSDRFPTVVLGALAARRLGFSAMHPGEPAPQIRLADRWFTVIGTLRPVPLAEDLDRAVLVSWQAARSQLDFDGRPTVVYTRADESAVESVRAVLPATINPQTPGLVQVSRPSDALAAKRATESAFSALFFGLAGVALLVGGIGVANTMVISVLERRREIGLRRALGANRGQIRGQFLTESVVLSGLGGAAGVLLGCAAAIAYASFRHWPPVIPAMAVAAGLGGAVFVGVIAGVYPAIRASRLTPTEALAST